MQKLEVTRDTARRFLVHAFALDGFQTLPDAKTAVQRLEYVQEDSINVCGRIHDLILWARVQNYQPSDLHQLLYETSPRRAFEYYFPNLGVLPITDYPHFLRAMEARRSTPGRWHGLLPEEKEVAQRVFDRIDAEGPLRTRSTGSDDGHTTSGWGTRTTVASRVIEKLWLHGHLTVARRENFERWFDRTTRLIPEVAGFASLALEEEKAYLLRKRRRIQRLFRLKKGDTTTLGTDAFCTVQIEGVAKSYTILAEDEDALRDAQDTPLTNPTLHFLAPLDPLIYDRERNRDLWDFDYIWEVYTPAAKRKYGYYSLPILHGDKVIGRMDPKIDRKTGMLTIHSLHLEPSVEAAEVAVPIANHLRTYARFLGAPRITVARTEPALLKALIERALA